MYISKKNTVYSKDSEFFKVFFQNEVIKIKNGHAWLIPIDVSFLLSQGH